MNERTRKLIWKFHKIQNIISFYNLLLIRCWCSCCCSLYYYILSATSYPLLMSLFIHLSLLRWDEYGNDSTVLCVCVFRFHGLLAVCRVQLSRISISSGRNRKLMFYEDNTLINRIKKRTKLY